MVVQLPPDQPVKRLEPLAAVGVIVIASPSSATQLVTFAQPAIAAASVIVAVPLPVPATAVAIVTSLAKVAVSVSPLAPAVSLQGFSVVVQLPPDQPVKRLGPLAAVGVIVIASPSAATQVVTPAQPAAASAIVAVPLPVPAAAVEMVTCLANVAVAVPVLAAAKVQGSVVPAHPTPDQPVKRLPAAALGVTVIESPT